jgi:hypothetical protein
MARMKDVICPHHPAEETGDPLFDLREFNRRKTELGKTALAPKIVGNMSPR